MTNPFSLEGKVALVTGANTGLGQGIALALAAAGADIAGAGIVPADETAEKVRALGRRFLNIEANLISIEPVERVVAETIAGLGRIDILVNNAGLIRRADAVDFSEKDWDDVMNVNIKSAFFMSQAAGKQFIAQGSGKIINIASMLSFQGGVRVPSYTASKSGIAGITAGLAGMTALGVPLTHRAHAHGVVFVTGHAKPGAAGTDWRQLAATARDARLTLVIYMGVSGAAHIQQELLSGLDASVPVAIIQNASLPTQRHAVTTLGALHTTIEREQLASPSVIVVGDVLQGLAAAAQDAPAQTRTA